MKLNYPEQEKLQCPRCGSINTKFCYYNNYNLLQPRHLCKNCRRYWTKGGALRKIPVGGGTRKNKSINKCSLASKCSSDSQAKPSRGRLDPGMARDSNFVSQSDGQLGDILQGLYPNRPCIKVDPGSGLSTNVSGISGVQSGELGDWNGNGNANRWHDIARHPSSSSIQ